jgi:peptidoglycan/LPS O-acetylase OafA/YrhL
VFVNRLTRHCGKISYSIYLIHPSAVFFLIPVYRCIYDLPLPLGLQYPLGFALTLAVVAALASLAYRWIEAPGMRLGKRLQASLAEGGAAREIGRPPS